MRFAIACLTGLILGLAPAFFHARAATLAKEPALQENFYGVHISENRSWIVGYYGTILHSRDRGQTWAIQASPTRRALFSVQFVSPLKGWISGSYGTILHTSDAGKSWRAHSVDTSEHLFASNWLEESHGWMAGSRGMTIRTRDGGRSWTNLVVPGDFTFNAVNFVNPLRGWLAGEFGAIFRTSDGGKTWVKQKSPIEVSFASGASQNLFALLFTKPTVGYAFGLDGVVLKTNDGTRWEIVRQREDTNGTTHHLFAAAAFNGRISVVGERGTLLQSDSLNQWRQADLQIPRLSLNGIAFGKDGFGLVVGNRGLVLRTENGGKTWKRLKINAQLSE
ncbi:MAG: WD40/YVTN/BNR-like repeat-containing protein [Candidatus Binatia bacterium]